MPDPFTMMMNMQ